MSENDRRMLGMAMLIGAVPVLAAATVAVFCLAIGAHHVWPGAIVAYLVVLGASVCYVRR